MKRKLTLAIDFDGTIVQDAYPNIGKLLPFAKETIRLLYYDYNCDIVIWTCRSGKEELDCEKFLIENNIPFTTINKNTPAVIQRWNSDDSRKVYADVYIDDRSQFADKYIDWSDILSFITKYKIKYSYKFI